VSFWRRWFGGEEDRPPEEAEEPEAEASDAPVEQSADQRLESLGEGSFAELDEDEVLALVEELRAKGREARAIDLARRLLAHHPDRVRIHQRVAEMLASRGDDDGAAALLEPFVDRPGAALDLWMLAAEIAERRSDPTRALALYERVVARDLDYPRARARVLRLREGDQKKTDVGATLLADGALTRGRYRVERELGRGGAGTVFLADDLALGRKVALKVYHRRGRAERSRLLAEARTPAKLEHPGVVRIFDLDETLAAIAMERVLGGSVRMELRKGALPIARIQRWFASSAEVLAYVHAAGIVHRDFKPSNMLLRDGDVVVLTDFGLAVQAGSKPTAGAGAGEGTLAFMPPEQRAGAAAHPSMDVFALGASMREVLDHAMTEPPAILTELAMACKRANPAQRPTAAWIVEQLKTALAPTV
jgi:eukaryotic-like serine/threonine-protein kinase